MFLTSFFCFQSAFGSSLIDIFIAENSQITLQTEAGSFTAKVGSSSKGITSKTIVAKIVNGSITIDGKTYGSAVILSSDKAISLNQKQYLGQICLTLEKDKIRVINRIDLEDYVAGVIGAEISGGAPIEALKAQAVATRTYTLSMINKNKHRNDNYDLCSTTHCQVYSGLKDQTANSKKAAKDTAGEVMTYKSQLIEAYYASFCGGITESAGNMWVTDLEYLRPKADNYCINTELTPKWSHKHLNWEKVFTYKDLQRLLGRKKVRDIAINKFNSSARVQELDVRSTPKNMVIKGQGEIRRMLDLPSNLFLIEKDKGKVKIIGNGYGHGVGLCQIGAIARANAGHSYKEILDFYYPGARVTSK